MRLDRVRRLLVPRLSGRLRPEPAVGSAAEACCSASPEQETPPPAPITLADQVAQLNERLTGLAAHVDDAAIQIASLADGLHRLRTDVQATNRRLEWIEGSAAS